MNTAPAVLVVEDERIVAIDLQQTLLHMGYDAYAVAASADEAISRAAERRPDIVLMDIRIDGSRDGVETAELLRAAHDVPIVYVTAYADDATLARAKQTAPHGYVVKPVKAAELKSMIEICLHRHAIEVRLRHHDRWLSTTLRAIADGVMTVDSAGQVTFMNPAAESLLGVPFADAEGRPNGEVTGGPTPTPLDEALALRRPVEHEGTIERADGTRMLEDRAAPVLDGSELLGAVMVQRDVTEQRRMTRQLELADRMVSLGTLAAGVAHEVNNPLAVVAASAELGRIEIQRALDSLRAYEPVRHETERALEEALEAQAEISSASDRIQRIVADLRLFGRAPEESEAVADVGRTLAWAVRTCRPTLRDRARVVVAVEPHLAAAIDETRLGQVIVNLLINAAHAIAPGDADANEVRVDAQRVDDDVVITVRDSGAGMTPDVMARMFDPFFTTRPGRGGSGLGLAICHAILASVGASIEAESAPGKGTTFRVRVHAAPYAPPQPVSPSSVPAPAIRGHVLAIDDEPAVLSAIARALRLEHDVVCVSSAQDALGRIDAGGHFDVILTDLAMPGMSGAALVDALAARHPELVSRVVLLSGGARTPEEAALFLRHPSLEKPFQLEALRKLVRRALSRARSH